MKKEPAYIPIHCEKQRRRDMRWRYRSLNDKPTPGATYAQKVDGRWECCCCGKRVLVVW